AVQDAIPGTSAYEGDRKGIIRVELAACDNTRLSGDVVPTAASDACAQSARRSEIVACAADEVGSQAPGLDAQRAQISDFQLQRLIIGRAKKLRPWRCARIAANLPGIAELA